MKIEGAGYKVVPLKTLLTTSVRNGYSPVCPETESGNWVLGLGALNGNGLDLSHKKPAPPNDQKIQDFLLSKGDFLVSRSNTLDKVGRASLFRGEVDNCAYPDLMMRFRVDEKKVNLEYLDTYLRTENIRHYFQIHAAGSSGSMVKITKSILEETPILLPPLPEQEKIASFLGAVDTRLNQLRRKRELLHTYKRGIMQKLFSQQLRFTQPNGSPFPDWENKRLKALFSEFRSGINITSEAITQYGSYPVFGGNGLRGYTESFTHDGFYFLIGRQGALCGNINRTYGKAYISEHAIACKANETSDTEWLAQRLDYYNLNKLSESSAQPGLSVNKLLRFKLFVPSKKEQEKITNFLTTIDRKIEALSRQIEQTEQFKQGLLQKLFV